MSFANTVELQIRENHKSYDLYIPSRFRKSIGVSGLSKEQQTVFGKSVLKVLYERDKEAYNKMIKSFQELANTKKMIFLGISNDSAVFIKEGKKILDTVNKYIDSYVQNARVCRIVLTEEISGESPPKCYPMRPGGIVGLSKSYHHKPNYNSSIDSYTWEPHIAEYYIDTPDLWLLPRKQDKKVVTNSN
tara:strand:+ start:945 stop:1511 length:567 start_codon:yes stop_codon:yes gene_type:complete